MSAVYDVKTEVEDTYFYPNKTLARLNGGWFRMYFGPGSTHDEVLFVQTKQNNFLQSSGQLRPLPKRRTPKRPEWVFAVDDLPSDFCDNSDSKPHSLSISGYRIVYGKDWKQRDFLFIELPNSELRLLFRNPQSESTMAWNPRRADSVPATPANPPVTTAPAIPVKYIDEGSGDAELDDLLASLG